MESEGFIMGYRSVVKIIFYTHEEKDFPALKLWVDENVPDEFDFTESANNPVWLAPGDGYRVLCCDLEEYKWYDTYAGVVAMEDALERFDRNNKSNTCAYEFIRIGEEYEDIEYRSSDGCENLLTVNREIEWS